MGNQQISAPHLEDAGVPYAQRLPATLVDGKLDRGDGGSRRCFVVERVDDLGKVPRRSPLGRVVLPPELGVLDPCEHAVGIPCGWRRIEQLPSEKTRPSSGVERVRRTIEDDGRGRRLVDERSVLPLTGGGPLFRVPKDPHADGSVRLT